MSKKWTILIVFVALYVLGIIGTAWHTYGIADPSLGPRSVEVIKIVFIMLGGLGVILPTYLNVWQSMETARLVADQARRNRIENTFRLLQ